MRPLLFFLIFHTCILANAQTGCSFNFNIENGLPSNRVYGVITDTHGYLWIATEKGVVKYNGYEFKLFNLSNGLPNEDVWELTEDRKGRIWLSNISDEFGYIYNDKYHKTTVKGSNNTIYPYRTRAFGSGIIFSSVYVIGNGHTAMCISNSDTIRVFALGKKDIGCTDTLNRSDLFPGSIFFNDSEQAILKFDRYLFKAGNKAGKIKYSRIFNTDSTTSSLIGGARLYDNYFINFSEQLKLKEFYAFNLNNKNKSLTIKEIEVINLEKYNVKGYVHYAFINIYDKTLYVISDNDILLFNYNNGIKYINKYSISDLITDKSCDGTTVRTILSSRLWGKCICTGNSGLWFNHEVNNNFIKEYKFDIREYIYVGRLKDSILFLWNPKLYKLAVIDRNIGVKYYSDKKLTNLKSIVPINSDTFLLTGSQSFFYINDKKARLVKCSENELKGDVFAAILDSLGRLFVIDRFSFYVKDDRLNSLSSQHALHSDKFKGLVYDSLKQSYWAYNHYKVFIHAKEYDTVISKKKLSNFGVKEIEKIIVDNKYGNIFFKGIDNITIYDHDKNRYKELFKNFNTKGASIFIYNNTLIVAGRFGILFCKILGPFQISEPLVYANIKNINYNFIHDCLASWGLVILNTDKGVYKVTIPSDKDILNTRPDSIFLNNKFIYNYRDTISNFKSGDAVVINQNFRRLQFDVINPFGNGPLKYLFKYADDSAWSELNANELTIPSRFKPGIHYKLSLKVYDNVWRSDPTDLYFYIAPHWWQTNTGLTIIWSAVALLVILLFVAAVLVTRKLVLEATKKRNLRMELELKAIYAQINPHFIFNTLNSALLLVNKNRMEEAYTHISKFSRLLRGYIKSSRNKLITIAEEIVNLKDYIDLQQTRFKNKFEYDLKVDREIRPEQIMIPSLLIQPFVENAINHGILPKKDTGHLKIEFKITTEKNEIICIIEDDGIGRAQSRLENESMLHKNASYGDLLIRDLVNIFNKYENMNIEISYTDKQPPLTGTIVTIQIKNPHHA